MATKQNTQSITKQDANTVLDVASGVFKTLGLGHLSANVTFPDKDTLSMLLDETGVLNTLSAVLDILPEIPLHVEDYSSNRAYANKLAKNRAKAQEQIVALKATMADALYNLQTMYVNTRGAVITPQAKPVKEGEKKTLEAALAKLTPQELKALTEHIATQL